MTEAKSNQPTDTFVTFEQEYLEKSIPERFEKIVAKYPDGLALKMGDRSLTYDELNKTINRIARAILENRGQGSEPIALLFEHGIDVIAAIFGTLKAGKFYIALDPAFPPHRNAYMLNDSQARLIVTNSRSLPLAHGLATNGRALLNIDELDHRLPCNDLGFLVAPESPMRILYTSGSTGNPKGVVRTHLISADSALELGICPNDRLSLVHSLSFGSANVSLFSSLLNGASLFPFDLKSEGTHRLANWLSEEQITVCHLPPAVFRQLADSLSTPERLTTLRVISLSGAPITQQDFDLYKKRFPSTTLLNILMGATEAGRCFSATLDQNFNFPQGGTPLGYPLAGKRVFLVDDYGQEVGPNQIGEIGIKSRNISPGYLKLPELSSAKFLPDADGGDERIYLTGDLGRMLPDGFLIHLGRKDSMVKIRGYRVELCEVEKALLTHPQVKDAGVAAWDREPGEKYLVAYLVPGCDGTPAIDDLRGFLRAKLPDYMIPSSFMFLPSLPLSNGKLDRAGLPLPINQRPAMSHPYVSPQTAEEQKLVQVWEEVLEVRPIGIHDDFFDLGGHSLLASRLFIQVEKVFGKQLPMVTLVYARTIEQLAAVLQQDGWTPPHSLLVPIQPNGSKPPLFWASGESSDFLLPRYLGRDQPLYTLMHQCHDGKPVRYPRLEDLAANHLQEIRRVQPQGPYFLGGYCFEGMVAFEMAQQLRQQGQEVALLALLDLASIKNCKFIVNQVPSSHESLGDEAFRHLHELAKLNSQDKLRYTLVRVKDRMNELIDGIKNIRVLVARSISRIYLMLGRPVPLSLLLPYISLVDRKILRVYEPRPYPGRLVHFRAETGSADAALVARLCSGNLEEVEISGNHFQLGKQPHLQVWATTLKTYLEQAQADELTKQPETCSATAQL